MRISDWSSDVCSSDLTVKNTLASNASSSVEITGRARSHASARGGKGRKMSAATITCPRRQGACLQSALPAWLRREPAGPGAAAARPRSEEHTSELQSLMRISYAVFCLKKKKQHN